MKQCNRCGAPMNDSENICPRCGAPYYNPGYGSQNYKYSEPRQNPYGQVDNGMDEYLRRNNPFDSGPDGLSRGVAGLLAIFLGYLGIEYFYIGKWQGGLITILLSLITCGGWSIVTLIQGIVMLCMSNAEFRRKFVDTPSVFPLF